MSELTAGAVTAFFDRVASDWDEMRLVYYDEAVIEHLAAAAELDASMTVADVGTGTGFVAAGLAGRVARVIGIDDSAGMLAVAEKNLQRARQSPTSSCAAATSRAAARRRLGRRRRGEHGPASRRRPRRHAREMARIVRPGGTVAICDEAEHPYAWMREEHADVWLGFTDPRSDAFFTAAGLERPSIAALGRQ